MAGAQEEPRMMTTTEIPLFGWDVFQPPFPRLMLLFIAHWRSHLLGNRVAFRRRTPRKNRKSKQMIIFYNDLPG